MPPPSLQSARTNRSFAIEYASLVFVSQVHVLAVLNNETQDLPQANRQAELCTVENLSIGEHRGKKADHRST